MSRKKVNGDSGEQHTRVMSAPAYKMGGDQQVRERKRVPKKASRSWSLPTIGNIIVKLFIY
jgi:hypothetical protein